MTHAKRPHYCITLTAMRPNNQPRQPATPTTATEYTKQLRQPNNKDEMRGLEDNLFNMIRYNAFPMLKITATYYC